MAGESKYDGLLFPYAIRHVKLKNRMVKRWPFYPRRWGRVWAC